LRTGEPSGLVAVGEHNRQDVVSLARLLAVLADHLGRPERRAEAPAGDLLGLGRAYQRHGRVDQALACLDAALTGQAAVPPGQGPGARDAQLQASIERARLLRRMGRGGEAIEAWRVVTDYGGRPAILAWIAIAKELEHRVRDPAAALQAVRQAEELLGRRRALGAFFPDAERDLPHRRARLRRRLATP
jgi:tetratricopeptide (TPR) repeat protein